jgi:protein-S-isoprenylcysteine O-methyltransferase Ste14
VYLIMLTIIRVGAFMLTIVLWQWLLRQTSSPFANLLCIVGTLLAVSPAACVAYLKVYEERELEIRFGQSYRGYRAGTSFLWPRKPKARRPNPLP